MWKEGYKPTSGTKWHILGGALYAGAVGLQWAAFFFAVCCVAYQIVDGVPRACPAWENTKWDMLELGFGSLLAGYGLATVRYILAYAT